MMSSHKSVQPRDSSVLQKLSGFLATALAALFLLSGGATYAVWNSSAAPATSATIQTGDWSSPHTPSVTRENLLPNPSFENNLTGWQIWPGRVVAGGALATVTTPLSWKPTAPAGAPSGAKVLVTNWSTQANNSGGAYYTTDSNYLTAGSTYTFSGSVWPVYAKPMAASFEWINAAGTVVSTTVGPTVNVAATTWARLSVTGVVPAGAVKANLTLYGVGSSIWYAGDGLRVDSALLEKSSTLGSYFDGDTPASGANSFIWTGTQGNSTSQELTTQ